MAIRKPLPPDFPPADRQLTVDDWFSMPDDGRQYELYEGVLILVSPPSFMHQRILFQITAAFSAFIDAHGGFAGFAPLGVALSPGVGYEPDLVFVADGRESILTPRGVEGVPDIVVEVLSPSTRIFDQTRKLRSYLEHGVREVWLVDPQARTTTVHTAGGQRVAAFGEDVPSDIVSVGDARLGRFAAG
jgi:Uma2 family endonuclease